MQTGKKTQPIMRMNQSIDTDPEMMQRKELVVKDI